MSKSKEAPCAVITGAAGGVGSAVAHRLAKENWRLHLIDIDASKLGRLRKNLPEDTTITESRLEDFEACKAALPGSPANIDALVHMAGIFVPHDFGPQSREIYDQTMQHNASSAFDLVCAALSAMSDGAGIVFASSLGFNRGVPDHAAYSMAKGALVGLTRALSRNVGGRNIRVNAVAPGIIDTPMIDDLVEQRGRETLLSSIPLGRFGQAEDVANVIAFLVSDNAAYVTGQVINVDGGIVNG